MFRALRAAEAEEVAGAVPTLAARLPDLPLLAPTLEAVVELEQAEPWVEAVLERAAERRPWCSEQQLAALAEGASAGWTVRAVQALVGGEDLDPTELAVERGVEEFCAALQEVLRLRLRAPAARRCRTSSALAEGALRALALATPDEDTAQEAARRVVAAEARRAGKGEPSLALAALDALRAAPALRRILLLQPLIPAIARRKVQTRAQEVLDQAVGELGASPEEVSLLSARDGGAGADGWVVVPLEEGDEARLRVGPDGSVEREVPASAVRGDDSALDGAERALRSAWDELVRRLELGLVAGTDWGVTVWRAVFGGEGHPLGADLGRRLLWERRGAGERAPFAWRDGAARDVLGDALDLPADARIGLAHPARMDADELELWREDALRRAADGAPLAPFPQVFREVAAPGDDPLPVFLRREAYKDAVEEMAQRGGWGGCPLRGAAPWEVWKELGPVRLEVSLDLVEVAFKATLAQRKAAHRRARDGEKAVVKRHREDRPRVRLTSVQLRPADAAPDPVLFAEAIADLHRLTDPLCTADDLFLRTWQQRKWKDAKAAWKEVVLRYRLGSPAALAVRRELVRAFAAREGLEVRLEDRFAITGNWVIELGTGLVHEGPPKDHLPCWKADELAAEHLEGDPVAFPFRRESAPETVAVVERVVGIARRAALA